MLCIALVVAKGAWVVSHKNFNMLFNKSVVRESLFLQDLDHLHKLRINLLPEIPEQFSNCTKTNLNFSGTDHKRVLHFTPLFFTAKHTATM